MEHEKEEYPPLVEKEDIKKKKSPEINKPSYATAIKRKTNPCKKFSKLQLPQPISKPNFTTIYKSEQGMTTKPSDSQSQDPDLIITVTEEDIKIDSTMATKDEDQYTKKSDVMDMLQAFQEKILKKLDEQNKQEEPKPSGAANAHPTTFFEPHFQQTP